MTNPFSEHDYFDSSECVDVVFDGIGDTTVRPIPPERLAQAIAERDKIARYSKAPGTPQSSPPKPDDVK